MNQWLSINYGPNTKAGQHMSYWKENQVNEPKLVFIVPYIDLKN